MARLCCVIALVLCAVCVNSVSAVAQMDTRSDPISETQDLELVIRSLFGTIEALSDYRAPDALPPVFEMPQLLIEAKVCDTPCNVTAAYVPREGIFLAENLDPIHQPLDRAALLHELVHYLQQGHPKFARLTPCGRERAKEQEAYAIQNAYLALINRQERVAFYCGEFDCDAAGSQ
jgi:hypothetical protein